MKLILIRHAAAIVSNGNRYLTDAGRSFFRKTARTIMKKGVEPNLILSSPKIRAVQTADILAETLSYVGPLIVKVELKSDFDMRALQSLLNEYPGMEEFVLVGHEPDMSSLTRSLLSLEEGFDFEKGTAVQLKINRYDLQAPAIFRWLAAGKRVETSWKEAFAPLPSKWSTNLSNWLGR